MSGGIGSVCFYCADQNPHRDRSLGITNYTIGLLNALKQSGLAELHAIVSKSSRGIPEGVSKTTLPFPTDNVLGRLAADHLHPVLIGNRIDARVWHYPKGFLPMGSQVRRPKIGTIADTILQFYADHYPNQRSRAAYAYWIAMLKNAVRKLDLIITVSEFSKGSILEFAERYHIKIPSVYVTYQGTDEEVKSGRERGAREYVLHLASTQPHKQTNWLLEQWQYLQRKGESLPPLRLIGQLDSQGVRLVEQIKQVSISAPVGRQEIVEAMRHALLLILPSEIEGFGLPALEAYYSGTPVVYAKGTAVEEVLGAGTPGGFSFQEDESFLRGLREVTAMSATEIAAKETDLRTRFAWERCADLTLSAYRDLS